MREIDKVNEAVAHIRKVTNESFNCDLAIMIGNNNINYETLYEIPYEEIPHFPVNNYKGKTGKLVLANVKGRCCYILNGSFHLYEGYTSVDIVRPIRIFKSLGVSKLIITNYAGAVNQEYEPGEIMLINDHINFGGDNPLRGDEYLDFGPKYPSMENAYSKKLQDIIRDIAITLDIPLNEGVYMKFFGPSFETPAEVRFARAVGADAIGMSLAYETIAAVQCGIEVAGISCITNMAAGMNKKDLNREEVIVNCINRLSLLIEGLMRVI